MAANGDLDKLGAVLDLYSEMAEGDEATVGVTVTTAVPLDNELRMLVTQKCELDLGRNVFLIEHVDPSITGGIILSVNGHRRDATVTTAVPLDNELRMLVTQKCELDLGRNVFLIEHVDPSITGGIILSVNGHRRDASVRHQLEQAYKVMTQPGMNSEV